MTTIGYAKKIEEIEELVTPKYLTGIWQGIKAADVKKPTPHTFAMLEILRGNLYQLRQCASIVDALLRTRPIVPKASPITITKENCSEIKLGEIEDELHRLCTKDILTFLSRSQSTGMRGQYQSPTMYHWEVHVKEMIAGKMREKMNTWEGRLLEPAEVKIPSKKLRSALEGELNALHDAVMKARTARQKVPSIRMQDDIVLLYSCASEAEQLCLTLQQFWCSIMQTAAVSSGPLPQKPPAYKTIQQHSWVHEDQKYPRREWFGKNRFEMVFGWRYPKARET
ncbi:hypothetical protein GSI_04943 [Ganoderma sinense ZZ0214-1]|uniref:Uncharacterized protein n=1 Tax=Ganoderma sinense ZZ0214-1 TaxID=1077348 RepID=A0A2G8SGD2_9APHY|nr:hypothetical protein GSI_04943 [Ganoderma sinense ZZ0214-1]